MARHFRILWTNPVLRMVTIGLFLFGCLPASISVYQSLIAITRFGLTDSTYSVILIVALMVSVSSAVGIGIITDQRPSRRLMALLAAGMLACGTGLVWAGQNATVFVLAHTALLPISGTLFGQMMAVARLASANLPRTDRDAILAIIRAIFAVPFVIVLPVWGWAFEQGLPLLSVYPAVMGLSVVLLALIWRTWPPDATAPWTEQKSGLGFRASLAEMATGPVFLRVLLVGAIHSGSAVCGVILGLIFEQTPGRGTTDVGLFFGLFVAIEVVVTLYVGQIVRLLPRLTVIAIGTLTYALFLALLPLLAPTPWVWALVVPAGAGGALVYALAIGYLQDLLGARAGAGASLIALQRIAADGLSAVNFAVGTWLVGYGFVAELGALTMTLAIAAILWLDRYRPL